MRGPAEKYLKLLVKRAEEEGLEPGGTLIQKGMFLLDDALGAGLDIRFKPYLYGPYSRELDSLAGYLERSGELGRETEGKIPREIAERVERVIALFKKAPYEFPEYKGFKARLWELLGATYYVMRYVRPKTETEEVVRAVREWKPYFDKGTIKKAMVFLKNHLREGKEPA